MIKKYFKKGAVLISVLALTAIILIVISTNTIISFINNQMGMGQVEGEKNFQATDSLAEEVIMRFIRYRNFTNPYPSWTKNCLQIKDFECKMELNLESSGGIVDIWGKVKDKIRHIQFQLDVLEDESVTVSAQKEL